MSRVRAAGLNTFLRLRTIARLVSPGLVLALLEFVLYAGTSMRNLV